MVGILSDLSSYIHTVSAFLQKGDSYAEVAIYLPQADVWSSMPLAELHMAMKLEEHIGRSLANRVQKSGYYFDYLNDEAVTDLSRITDSGMEIGANRYKAMILPKAARMPLNTANRFAEYVRSGGILVSVAERPSAVPGYIDRDSNNRRLAAIMERLFDAETGVWKQVGKGKTIHVANEDQLVARLLGSEAPMSRSNR